MIRVCFLACWILTFSTVALQSTRYALPGQMVTFDPAIETQPDEILWKHNGNKVVEFNGKKETVYSPFKGRITLDWQAAVLEIKQLSHSDSGEYELDVLTEKTINNRLSFILEVIDRVAKPTIFCKMNNGSSSSDTSGNEATLTCSADSEQSQLLTFEWSQRGKTHPGPTLKILLGEEHDDEVYSCTVSNRLSNEVATFTAKDCYLVSRSTGLSAAIAIILLLCALGILGLVYYKLKHKESKKEEDKDAPIMAPEHKEKEQDADQVIAETKEEKEEYESDDLGEKITSPTTDEQTGLAVSNATGDVGRLSLYRDPSPSSSLDSWHDDPYNIQLLKRMYNSQVTLDVIVEDDLSEDYAYLPVEPDYLTPPFLE